ncbi:MAG: ErfK/YbiS/YcfS/YnhG family protein [Gemmatimonadetes bacterium]|nr:ErfK/YbiS/YcfS/YnhG family protein [Gemmatimonadota bacterium]
MIQRRTRSLIALFAVPLAGALVFGLGAAGRSTPDDAAALHMTANLSSRKLTILRGDSVIKEYAVAVGHPNHPTPTGNFTVHKLVWNPAWVPPDAGWAKGKKPTGPGDSRNPMKTVKIFFQEPDYYIHGTGAVESLGEAASHGCLRMDPNDAAEVALLLMDNAGQEKDWDWVRGILHLGEQRVVNLGVPAPLSIGS